MKTGVRRHLGWGEEREKAGAKTLFAVRLQRKRSSRIRPPRGGKKIPSGDQRGHCSRPRIPGVEKIGWSNFGIANY